MIQLFNGNIEHDRIFGVVVGIVKSNALDSLGRIEVTFPGLSSADVAHRARLAVPMAGNARGMFFLPEINDEVLVAFEHGDITRPCILGALWNGRDKPPETNADGKNNRRFIKSRSGHLICFDDTDGKEKIEIIDRSGNNALTIDSAADTISITSAKDIHIEANQGKIRLRAQAIELESSAETKIQGQGGLTLDGSPGTTTVKGTTVNIN